MRIQSHSARPLRDSGSPLTPDSDFFATDGPAPFGFVEDGEVEDYVITGGTLPVSISGFESRKTREGLEVSWSTVSETENVGFYLWNYAGGELELLTPDMIPSKTGDAAHPQDYSYTIRRSKGSQIGKLAITAVDNRGKEEMYGLFGIDATYGRGDASTPIDWAGHSHCCRSAACDAGLPAQWARPGGLIAEAPTRWQRTSW